MVRKDSTDTVLIGYSYLPAKKISFVHPCLSRTRVRHDRALVCIALSLRRLSLTPASSRLSTAWPGPIGRTCADALDGRPQKIVSFQGYFNACTYRHYFREQSSTLRKLRFSTRVTHVEFIKPFHSMLGHSSIPFAYSLYRIFFLLNSAFRRQAERILIYLLLNP